MESRIMVSINMYDQNDRKESAKSRIRTRDSAATNKGGDVTSEASSVVQLTTQVGHNKIETVLHRNHGPWVRAAQLPKLFCSWDLAYRCTRCGWLRPVVQGKRRTIYRLADVLACLQRIEAGELPLPRHNKTLHSLGN
jgi:hypothetical protein